MVSLGSHGYVQTLKGQTLKGQTLRFPNLALPMKDWPKGLNPHCDDLQTVQHTEVKKLVGEGKAYNIYVSTDCPYFAALFPERQLGTGAAGIANLYLWDDAIDSPELTDLGKDLDASNRLRQETKKHAERYLRDEPLLGFVTNARLSPAVRSLDPIGETVAFRMPRGQRVQVSNELERYIDGCAVEQLSELSGRAPTIEEYLQWRMGTSRVGFVLACLEYILGIDLGDTIRNDEYVKVVFDETVFNIAIVNDILSLRRELRYPFYNNAVAVFYHQHEDLQKAVDETHRLILRSIEKLEQAVKRAVERYSERQEDLVTWIDGCKTMCTGNVTWSLYIPRFALGVEAVDGTTEITI
ncbi:isoprenoid synthase domain-containing protein [Mycena albidolilacea]|uniref:Terpene synthase n=1 Tax=Mycena albidolilacea TaxID=1033008 RepID=A0AAD6ZUD2_9AGAR|nr:isoprenoid synthase domain-containing protein [Mycena albidolilacea]